MNKEYLNYLKSDDWLTKKYLKRLKANRCGICNSKETLHIHHLNYRNLTDVELSDLRVLKAAVKKELEITNQNMFYR